MANPNQHGSGKGTDDRTNEAGRKSGDTKGTEHKGTDHKGGEHGSQHSQSAGEHRQQGGADKDKAPMKEHETGNKGGQR